MESNNSNVSVIIPTHNRVGMICRAINSVIPQLTVDDEIIVIDDGSTDGTEELLKKVRDKIVYRRIPHGGAGRARNEGIEIAHNGLIAFLDSDDEWMPKKIELQRALLQARPDILFCVGDIAWRIERRSDHNGRAYLLKKEALPSEYMLGLGSGVPFSSIARLPEGVNDFLVYIGDFYGKQMERECLSVTSLIYRCGSIDGEKLKYSEDLPTAEDQEFLGKLARKGLAAWLDYELVMAHRHDDPQLTKQEHSTWLNARIKLLERVWGTDTEYLNDHHEDYLMVNREVHMNLIREYLCRGRMLEAREEIRKNMNAPILLKILSRFPGFVNKPLFRNRSLYRLRTMLRNIGFT